MPRAALTPQQILDNWKRGMQSGATQQKYQQGIDRYIAAGGNPMAAAVTPDAQARYLAHIQQSMDKRVAKLNAVPISRYQTNAKNAASQLGTGATKASDKYMAAMQVMAPAYAQASSDAHAISKDQPLERVRAAINAMKRAVGKPTI